MIRIRGALNFLLITPAAALSAQPSQEAMVAKAKGIVKFFTGMEEDDFRFETHATPSGNSYFRLRSPRFIATFRPEGDFMVFWDERDGDRTTKRPAQGTKFLTQAAWENHAKNWLEKLYPGVVWTCGDFKMTGEKTVQGKSWWPDSSMVQVSLYTIKADKKMAWCGFSFDRASGKVLSFTKHRPIALNKHGRPIHER